MHMQTFARIVTSRCDDPHCAPTADLENIPKCRHLHAIVTIRVIVHNMPTQETMSERHMFRGQQVLKNARVQWKLGVEADGPSILLTVITSIATL